MRALRLKQNPRFQQMSSHFLATLYGSAGLRVNVQEQKIREAGHLCSRLLTDANDYAAPAHGRQLWPPDWK